MFRKLEDEIKEVKKDLDEPKDNDIKKIVSETEDVLAQVSEPLELVELIIDLVVEFTKAERGFLMLFDEEDRLQFKIGRNNRGENVDQDDFLISQTIVQQTLAKKETVYVGDTQVNEAYRDQKSIQDLNIHSCMCTPLRKGERIIGIIYVDNRSTISGFLEEGLGVFEAFADHVAKYL